MVLVHRQTDKRICGASTVVQNQKTVTVDGKLWSTRGDPNSHGSGGLINTTGSTVTIVGIPVIVHGPDRANPDNLCPPSGPPHCNPVTAQGATYTSCYGVPGYFQFSSGAGNSKPSQSEYELFEDEPLLTEAGETIYTESGEAIYVTDIKEEYK